MCFVMVRSYSLRIALVIEIRNIFNCINYHHHNLGLSLVKAYTWLAVSTGDLFEESKSEIALKPSFLPVF